MAVHTSGGSGTAVAPRARPRVVVRRASLGDLGTVSRIYRGQSDASRKLYHPFPFDRFRLGFILLYMVATRPFVRALLRIAPRRALVLLVATLETGTIIGYGNISFVPRDGRLKALFGYLVSEEYRGLGVGTHLHQEMIEAALALGVTRGGGMVIRENAANLRVLEKLGFTLRESTLIDRAAPEATNIETDGDLERIAARWRTPGADAADRSGEVGAVASP